ncbi:helix-turn-helix domain-containing protein [Kitasatospora sp. NPDC018058]|uniref:helix-turn-helix domain-containing protein n=1 Tax=Kitasatospora sp. NPDC018058 TaxID=3364025 RepID=UPI0037BE4D55
MGTEDKRTVSDVKAMRALAHPTRLDLLELLRERKSLTASQCAEQLGLSPKVCSYHLNQLAESGLIEEAGTGGGDRRERPWKLAYTRAEASMEQGTPAADAARDQAIRLLIGRNHDQALAFADILGSLPPEWQQACTITSRRVMMTSTELRGWSEQMEYVTREHVARTERHALEEGSEPDAERRPVRLICYGFPEAAK